MGVKECGGFQPPAFKSRYNPRHPQKSRPENSERLFQSGTLNSELETPNFEP